MKRRVPIGTSDFKELIEENYYFIDKSLFIEEVWNHDAKVLLIPRPRRFGKTVNLSMLRYFFEQTEEETSTLFQNLAIQKEKEIMEQQGQHPVISLTFKGGKQESYEQCILHLRELVSGEYRRHRNLLNSLESDSVDIKTVEQILNKTSNEYDLGQSILRLTNYLYQATGKKVVVLLDEYDAMIHGGVEFDYYEKIVVFMRSFMEAAFKDNPYLKKGVLTGILRVSRESIFSGLNNLTVSTLLDKKFSAHFGLTEPELIKLLEDYGLENNLENVRNAYNGYLFGDRVIYNPWSVLHFVSTPEKGMYPHWLNTSGNQLIYDLVMKGPIALQHGLQTMLNGGSITIRIQENMTLRELNQATPDMLWNFFLFTGYLTPKKFTRSMEMKPETLAEVAIPNEEIHLFFRDTFQSWLKQTPALQDLQGGLLQALLAGDIQKLGETFQKLVTQVFSYHDTKSDQTESFYHAFMLGLLIRLKDRYRIRSNREEGFGRYDIQLLPKNSEEPGFIIELKQAENSEPEHMAALLEEATDQIKNKEYATELKEAGIKQILGLAVVAKGKDIYLQGTLLGDQSAFGWSSPVQNYPDLPERFEKQVVVCYTQKDKKWLPLIQDNLKVLEMEEIGVAWWDVKRINSMVNNREMTLKNLTAAKVVVLLISTGFLASDLIIKNELPPLLKEAEKQGVTILPIILSPCRFEKIKTVAQFQPFNNAKQPFNKLSSDEQNEMLLELTDKIEELF